MTRINVWIALLLVSVLLNGVLIGAGAHRGLIGGEAVSAPLEAPPGMDRGFDPRRFVRALPEAYQPAVRERIEAGRPEVRALVRDMAQARRRAFEALTAEPFDPEAAASALADARAARGRLEAHAEAFLLEAAADLPAEVRQEAFSRASAPRRRHDGPRHGDRPERH